MMFLDTHVVVWLYAGEVSRFPSKARNRIDREVLFISPMVQLEIQFLNELGRLIDSPSLMLKELEKSLGLTLSADSFENVVLAAMRQTWTRDPFDRLIVAQAQLQSAPLLTKDEAIRKHYREALWD